MIKKISLLLLILVVIVSPRVMNKNEINQTRKGYNVYLQNGDTYVLSNDKSFPKSGYVLNVSESSCTNGGIITQNSQTKEISVEVSGPDKCNFYFDQSSSSSIIDVFNDVTINKNTTDIIELESDSNTCTNTLAYDGTVDNNLRYVGANPCNYVTFNGESPSTQAKWVVVYKPGNAIMSEPFDSQSSCQTYYNNNFGGDSNLECQNKQVTIGGWRIIGLMNNVDDGAGHLETRIKLIRNSPLGDYSWDTSASGVNNGWGFNEWTQADIKNELNGDYLNTSLNANTSWYKGYNDGTATYDYTKGLKVTAQNQIADAKWYLGGGGSYFMWDDSNPDGTVSTFYGNERGNEVWGTVNGSCDDSYCPRSLNWTGKVALMYPSDYGYAVGGTVRNTCLGINMYKDIVFTTGCYNNNWLRPNTGGWTISPFSDGNYITWSVEMDGHLAGAAANGEGQILPVVYLKSTVSISGGSGTESDPYQIG